ncbi:unnamed protein product [Schistosoma spindalis]|nr:unnamed protein product [Schistosoma spindale]
MEDELMVRFGVCSLFTNVPITKDLDIANKLLDSITQRKQRCLLGPSNITKAMDLCLYSTFFNFRDLYRQTKGEAMGLQVSPIIDNLLIHSSETSAVSKYPLSPKIWLRYVHDTFVIIKGDGLDELFININSLSDKIQFTRKLESAEHRLPFLDCLVQKRM